MRRADYWILSWPGLRLAWRIGEPLGLAWAGAFSILFNLAVVSTFVWPQLLGPNVPLGLWIATVLVWLGSAAYEFRCNQRMPVDASPAARGDDALFIQAQAEYLKGHWEEAEWLLRQRLSSCHRDIESRLLLVTLYRRRGQPELAAEQLQILRRFDGALAWSEEIEREAQHIEALDEQPRPLVETAPPAASASDSTAETELRKMNTKTIRRAA